VSAAWTDDELRGVGAATELQVATRRVDGSLRPYVTIWTVRAGHHLYVRSAYGTANPWFRRATASGSGRIRAGGIERDVSFTSAGELDAATLAAVDAAYHAKYDRYGPQIVGTVTGAHAAAVTLRLDPDQAA
jgi:hypothetical protein